MGETSRRHHPLDDDPPNLIVCLDYVGSWDIFQCLGQSSCFQGPPSLYFQEPMGLDLRV